MSKRISVSMSINAEFIARVPDDFWTNEHVQGLIMETMDALLEQQQDYRWNELTIQEEDPETGPSDMDLFSW